MYGSKQKQVTTYEKKENKNTKNDDSRAIYKKAENIIESMDKWHHSLIDNELNAIFQENLITRENLNKDIEKYYKKTLSIPKKQKITKISDINKLTDGMKLVYKQNIKNLYNEDEMETNLITSNKSLNKKSLKEKYKEYIILNN